MSIQVVVAQAVGPRDVREIALGLAEGSTVRDAIEAAGLLLSAADLNEAAVGVWGRPAALVQRLHDLDRVEIYRPLKVDPKVARRTRFASQGVKKAGLFANNGYGGKTGSQTGGTTGSKAGG